ncbi:MAG: bifunctional metallophosphatase/5'-nucleotidase [Cytophagales bacterium]
MNRRDFIYQSALTAGALALSTNSFGAISTGNQDVKLTILHTNDVHSRIEPFPANAAKNAGLGGVARRATLIKQIRAQEPNVLLLDAGDAFQGTPYFNFFGGELEFKLMTKLGYDAATLGNHDFDNGIAGFEKYLPEAKFPFLIANYDFKNNSLHKRFSPYQIFEKQGVKIGVFGIGIDFEGLVPEKLHGKTIYIDPIATAKEMVQELQRKKCDLIICLSHLGYKYAEKKVSDIILANEVSGIDLIIGGHTHTFLDQPLVSTNKEGFSSLINQVGFAGINLGRIDYTFSKKKSATKVAASASILIDGNFDNG